MWRNVCCEGVFTKAIVDQRFCSGVWSQKVCEMAFLRKERSMVRIMCGRQEECKRHDVDAGFECSGKSVGCGKQCVFVWTCFDGWG